jgi:competence protein ComEC
MVAVLIMIMYEPRILLYDPGFQLSVIATLGLVYIAPLIARRLPWVSERFTLREIVAATIGTQFAVAPLLLYQTGLFSIVSLPVNLLVLPIVPAAMFASFIAGVVGSVSQVAGVVLGAPAYVLLEYMLVVAETAAAFPAAAVSAPLTSLAMLMAVYVVLVAFVWFMRQREPVEIAVPQRSS